jgi:hypothetical protein
MRALSRNNIVDVFVWVDDAVASYPKHQKPGTRSVLTDSDVVTILVWDSLTEPHKTLRSVYDWITRDYQDCFPNLPRYQNFVAHCHRILPLLVQLLTRTLSTSAPLRFADSTMLPVCRHIRADRHKVARGSATFGKNWQGWHYGFKLHASIDYYGRLAAVWFTGANEADVLQLKHLVNTTTRVVVADAGYTARSPDATSGETTAV